jgi:hypothetical protein
VTERDASHAARMERGEVLLSPQSMQALLLMALANGRAIGTATGFVCESAQGPVLLTNRHVVTGRRQDNGQPISETAAVPDELEVVHHSTSSRPEVGETRWASVVEPLYTPEGAPRWREHPRLGATADIAALPLTQFNGVQLNPMNLEEGPLIECAPGDIVSVIGFPFGRSAGGRFPIWSTGFVASEIDIDPDGLPIFYIDCRSRPGQSGAPVVAFRNGGVVPVTGRGMVILRGPNWRFYGIYSGRINTESDLGIVWKCRAVRQLLDSLQA